MSTKTLVSQMLCTYKMQPVLNLAELCTASSVQRVKRSSQAHRTRPPQAHTASVAGLRSLTPTLMLFQVKMIMWQKFLSEIKLLLGSTTVTSLKMCSISSSEESSDLAH